MVGTQVITWFYLHTYNYALKIYLFFNSFIRFVSEYYESPNRGYGGSVVDVFAKLKESKSGSDPYAPAREQFDGAGSYGNGGKFFFI